MTSNMITVEALINAPIEKVWEFWTKPEHIMVWNAASDDWHTPSATNDLRTGGKFTSRMEAKDGSFGFDFEGIYDEVINMELIKYSMADGRKVQVDFIKEGNNTQIIEKFDPESVNPIDMQKTGWQAILNNFKKYTEAN
ncbi:MAG: SRPBCC family protein [Bacteroidetes bacterium]|nr:SRPBCC family protein [Bacteroidota bacterium]